MSHGFSVVNFINMPPVERRIMRMVLREVSMTYPELRDAVATLPAEQRPDESKLNATLDQLTRDHWLERQVNGQNTAYRMSEMPRASSHRSNLWDRLELESIDQPYTLQFYPPAESAPRTTTSGGKRTLPSQLWDSIIDDGARKEQ